MKTFVRMEVNHYNGTQNRSNRGIRGCTTQKCTMNTIVHYAKEAAEKQGLYRPDCAPQKD
jgi:hypothetical protein